MSTDADQQNSARWLLELGNGSLHADNVALPNSLHDCHVVSDDIISDVSTDMRDLKAIAKTVILTPTNETAMKLNDKVLQNKVPGPVKLYVSADKAVCEDKEEANNYPP